jgi:uncharacterized membrane-anchored protein
MKASSHIVGITLNTGLLVIFYVVFGGLLSYLLYYIFDEHDADWEQSSSFYQISMVILELVIIGVIGIWAAIIINEAPPVFHVSKKWDRFVDSYVAGVFFAFAMFLFLDNLSTKLKFLYHKFLGKQEEHLIA